MKIGYVRVSDQNQDEALQIDALKKVGCDAIYGDHGVTGASVKRLGLDQVLEALESGDALVVWKLDRLGRSTVHLLTLLDELHRRGVDFVSLTQGIDTTTPVGRMLYGQLAVFAEFERAQISERTKAGMEAARRRGRRIGRPPALSEAEVRDAYHCINERGLSVRDSAKRLGVCGQTLKRAFVKLRLAG
ncbi:MAG: recombinase family protein [Alphaproteobacteria bacterium]